MTKTFFMVQTKHRILKNKEHFFLWVCSIVLKEDFFPFLVSHRLAGASFIRL